MIIIKAFLLAKMVIFNDAPDMTKKSIKIGGVIISILSKIRSESFLKLTTIAPIIIEDNNAEIDISACIKVFQSTRDKPTQIKMAAMHKIMRFERDLNSLQANETKNPSSPPMAILLTIDTSGHTNKSMTLGVVPFAIAVEIENRIEKAINATASSKATTGNNVLTTGP